MNETLITLTNQEKKNWVADWHSKLYARSPGSSLIAAFQWARIVMQSMTAVVITATGILLVHTDITASKAGFILSFALMVSSGEQTPLKFGSSLTSRSFQSSGAGNQR
jgi:hypothetical protein